MVLNGSLQWLLVAFDLTCLGMVVLSFKKLFECSPGYPRFGPMVSYIYSKQKSVKTFGPNTSQKQSQVILRWRSNHQRSFRRIAESPHGERGRIVEPQSGRRTVFSLTWNNKKDHPNKFVHTIFGPI